MQKREVASIGVIIEREFQRYKRKEWGLVFAIAQICFYLYILPEIGQRTWPIVLDLMKQYDLQKWQIAFINTCFYNTFLYFFINFCFWIIYHIEHPFFEQYKIYDGQWPWKEDLNEWKELLRKSYTVVGINNFIVIPIAQMIVTIKDDYQVRYSFEMEDLPDWKTILWQILFSMWIQDFFFTASHWLLHKPFFYKKIHKLHHQYNQTIGFSAEYTHPFEFLFGNAIPFIIPAVILGQRMHYYTYIIWGTHRILNTVILHSGYDFPWLPNDMCLFYSNAQYHDYHHSHNVGNFGGMFSIWDTLIGTNHTYYKYIDERINVKNKQQKAD
ncbi:sterol desaturase family protein [Stylonychia lemnae]|uniref:Sterol desaturase family protein n=1 Tax=Stylonychia lemnae TaxID=5949 RepID=A0A078A6A6_STYLE|nr:sterol desaturase family protein [Stylonychia lemnae]|eukprot:CDW77386.1 sterol desaturase family protein [Stylonychia lemnae]